MEPELPQEGPPKERASTVPLDEVEELLLDCLDRLEESGDQALEAFLAEHPQHADDLRLRLDSLRGSGLLGGDKTVPERLGDFEILERLGEGGMGVVYRARQSSLGREVALKLIRPEHLYFAGARERFQREVETIARLDHPGIVAVHSVGEDTGVPYFAMELVRGRSVESLLEEHKDRPVPELTGADLDPLGQGSGYLFQGSWEEACLRVMRQVCEALEFAHDHDILHRDLKPSNMMIASGGNSRALLLDFGLASAGTSDKLTRTGSQLGSLRYMSPEQMRGSSEAVTRGSDVYSLGVSLFEMLTLTPAFEGSQAQIAVAVTQKGLPLLRSRNPLASWEAETICATATDPDPARRYATAADMARDLANALERRPLEARRAGAWLRIQRWVERNPASAVAVGLATLLLIGAPTGFAVQQHHSSKALAAERDRAVIGFEKAMVAVDRMLASVGAVELASIPAMEGLRRRLLEDAVVLLEEVLEEGGEDISGRGRVALAGTYKRLGQLLGTLGRSTEAVPAMAEARRLLQLHLADAPEDRESLLLLVSVTIEECSTRAEAGDTETALELHHLLAEELEARADDEDFEEAAARNQGTMAWVFSRQGKNREAVETFEKACARLDRLVEAEDTPWTIVLSASTVWNNFGKHYLDPDANSVNPRALEALDRALELARRTDELHPLPYHKHIISAALNNLAGAHRRSGSPNRADELYMEARTLLQGLVDDYPDTLSFRLELATVINQMGLMHDIGGRIPQAGVLYRQSAGHIAALIEAAPNEPLYQHRYAITQYNVSFCEKKDDDLVAAEETVRRGVIAARRAVELARNREEYKVTLMQLLSVQRQQYEAVGDHAAMAASCEELVEAVPELARAWHRAAYGLANAHAIAKNDEWIEPEERAEAAAAYAERACEFLREAARRGTAYVDLRQFQDFQPLHGTKPFEELLVWYTEYRAEHPLQVAGE